MGEEMAPKGSGVESPAVGGQGVSRYMHVKALIGIYYDIQKLRIAVGNRAKVDEFILCVNNHMIPRPKRKQWDGETCPICGAKAKLVFQPPPPLFGEIEEWMKDIEKRIYAYIYGVVKDEQLWKFYLSRVRGIGPVLAAGLITILNPARFETVSKMWKYSGLHTVNGKAPRRVRGQKVDWNPTARKLCWLIGRSFQMVGGVYKQFYRMFYDESLRKHPDWTKAHHIAHARRVTVKLFLSHYWEVGRRLMGLPVRKPYIIEKEPHRYIPPVVDYLEDYSKDEFYLRLVRRIEEDYSLPKSFYPSLLKQLGLVKEVTA